MDVDAALTGYINGLAGWSFCDALMTQAASYGVPLIVALVAVQWFSRGDRAHIRHVAIVAGLAFLLGLGLNQLVLLGVHRVRPYDAGVTRLLIAKSADWSFPSDHATASLAVALVFWAKGVRWWAWAFTGLAALVCFARVYLGIHYAGDILGGAATAFLAVLLVVWGWREGNRVERVAVGVL